MKALKSRCMLPLVMLMVSFGLITGCGNKKSGSDEMNSDSTMTTNNTTYNQGSMKEQSTAYSASLSGKDEVPAVETDARGSVKVTVMGDSVQVQGRFRGLSSAFTAAHIHKGAEGSNGAPIQPLNPEINNDEMSGSFDSSYKMNAEQLESLQDGDLYINVHSKEHPKGEIRGQLSKSGTNMDHSMDKNSEMNEEDSME